MNLKVFLLALCFIIPCTGCTKDNSTNSEVTLQTSNSKNDTVNSQFASGESEIETTKNEIIEKTASTNTNETTITNNIIKTNEENDLDDRLCRKNESIILSFKIKNSKKILSICKSNDLDYIVYRFGTKDRVELEYPADKANTWNEFSFRYYLRPGGADNCGLSLNYLKFQNENFIYIVYDEYSAESESVDVGVAVYDTSKKIKKPDVTDRYFGFETDCEGIVIEGDSDSKIGYLDELRFLDKMNVEGL